MNTSLSLAEDIEKLKETRGNAEAFACATRDYCRQRAGDVLRSLWSLFAISQLHPSLSSGALHEFRQLLPVSEPLLKQSLKMSKTADLHTVMLAGMLNHAVGSKLYSADWDYGIEENPWFMYDSEWKQRS
ncbi:MAG: hypothetical protein P4M11_15405 [Candidatus Pacebacteria bacterium]|nr:hypothetical protein [Candidatus Paceibacterota bacterium]